MFKSLFLSRVFYILFEKLTNNFLQIFLNFLKKNFKILLNLLYCKVKIFAYFIQKLNRCAKNLPLFSTNYKISHVCFSNFVEFLLFLWNILKFFPQFIYNSSNFPKYFLKIFTLIICLNIVSENVTNASRV